MASSQSVGDKMSPQQRRQLESKPLASKFYARHDKINQATIKDRAVEIEEEIEKQKNFDLRRQRLTPRTENQMYGWLENRAMPVDPKNPAQRRYPYSSDEFIKMQTEIYRYVLNKHTRI